MSYIYPFLTQNTLYLCVWKACYDVIKKNLVPHVWRSAWSRKIVVDTTGGISDCFDWIIILRYQQAVWMSNTHALIYPNM